MPIEAYNLRFPDGVRPADIELACFHRGHPPEMGGLGRYGHLKNAIDLLCNEPRRRQAAERKLEFDPEIHDTYIWNDWTEWMQETFCEDAWVTITGPAASWKTTSAALYANCFWSCSPHDSVVIATSTTLDGLRRRVWKEVTKFHRWFGIGNLVQSRNCIQFQKGSDDAGIFGIAVDKGEVEKAVSKIIGFHARRMLVIVDEMQTMNEAIVEACVNLESGAEVFQFIGLGNALSKFDPHGRMSEPKEGWNSIDDRTPSWRTKRGVCVHLDGRDSPNIRAGYDKYPGMLKQRDLDNTIERDGENSPQFWQMRIGFWAPEGITKTVLSETMIDRFKAREKPVWIGEYREGAGLDPAFEGGDRCVLRIGRVGKIEVEGKERDAFDPSAAIIPIKLDVTSKEPIHYQIVRIVRQECEARGIPREWFALDTTGEGGGLASIFAREWGPGFHEVEFGGRASEEPVSENNPLPASKEYLYRVTELWFNFRTAVQNGQVRGLDDETAIEFCKRFYEMRGPLIQIEPKSQMKLRTGKSPDLADACVVLFDLFKKRMGLLSNGRSGEHKRAQWQEIVQKFDVRNRGLRLKVA